MKWAEKEQEEEEFSHRSHDITCHVTWGSAQFLKKNKKKAKKLG